MHASETNEIYRRSCIPFRFRGTLRPTQEVLAAVSYSDAPRVSSTPPLHVGLGALFTKRCTSTMCAPWRQDILCEQPGGSTAMASEKTVLRSISSKPLHSLKCPHNRYICPNNASDDHCSRVRHSSVTEGNSMPETHSHPARRLPPAFTPSVPLRRLPATVEKTSENVETEGKIPPAVKRFLFSRVRRCSALRCKEDRDSHTSVGIHPLFQLRRLGATISWDAPIGSFLDVLRIQNPVSHQSSNGSSSGGDKSVTSVQIADVEGSGFLVRVSSPEASPIRDLVAAYENCLWDGAEFVVTPLCDFDPLCSNSDFTSSTRSHFSPAVGMQPTHKMRSHFPTGCPQGSGYSGPSVTSPLVTVEKWKRYSAAVALYMALGEAGFCDTDSFPFLSVQLSTWGELAGSCATRLQVLLSGMPAPGELLHMLLTHSSEQVPVAVSFPATRKGSLRRLPAFPFRGRGPGSEAGTCFPVGTHSPNIRGSSPQPDVLPSIVTQPFTDAEVFQLIYLQLIFRALFDVRFPSMLLPLRKEPPSPPTYLLRSDKIGVRTSGRQGLAFQHPTNPLKWLLFPPSSRLLTLLCMEDTIIPLYSTADQLSGTASLPLLGAAEGLPCQGKLGYIVAQWAVGLTIDSPKAAAAALEGLFDIFQNVYGCAREDVWYAEVPPKIFRCDGTAASAIRTHHGDLSRFFVTPDAHGHPPLGEPTSSIAPGSLCVPTSSAPLNSCGAVGPVPSSPPGASGASMTSIDVKRIVETHEVTCDSLLHDETSDIAPFCTPVVGMGGSRESFPLAAVEPRSLFTMQESLVSRWREYIKEGRISIFDGSTDGMELTQLIGKGGSGLVYRGCYGHHHDPVAIKVFVLPPGMDHLDYVRESLTDVAFFVLFNQLDAGGICHSACAYDFIVSNVAPRGLPAEDARTACRGSDPATTKLCYFVTDLMDGTLGRFLTEEDEDYDPCYDTLVNSPLSDAELFQFLYMQLVLKAIFDYRVLDIMVHGQIRGDNIGYRYVARLDPGGAPTNPSRKYFQGLLFAYQPDPETPLRYLRFSANPLNNGDAARFICFIDLGQGMQPNVLELTRQRLIGETVVDSCVNDDGFGRYWPPNEIYCKYVDVKGPLGGEAVRWGSSLRITTQRDALNALTELFELFFPQYGVEAPSEDILGTHALFLFTPRTLRNLKAASVYHQIAIGR